MIDLTAKSWTVVPIIEGMGYWAVNPKRVGYFKRSRAARVRRRRRAHAAPEQKAWPQ